jgi:uncharacterized protein YfiM (DUF2279 family)
MSATWISILAFFAVLLAIGAVVALTRDIQQSDATRIRKRISETLAISANHYNSRSRSNTKNTTPHPAPIPPLPALFFQR